MLQGLMAVSRDGFVSTGPGDDMRWTGREDKALFRARTMGRTVGAGSTTHALLPELPGRTVLRISREAPTVDGPLFVPSASSVTLDDFFRHVDGGILIGGQTVLLTALSRGYVDRVALVRVPAVLGLGERDLLTPWCLAHNWLCKTEHRAGSSLTIRTWRRGA